MSNAPFYTEFVKSEAIKLGFDAVGIAGLEPFDKEFDFFKNWLNKGHNASMYYLEQYLEKRKNPQQLIDRAKSAIVVLINYKPAKSIPSHLPQIAKYAYGADYHFVVKNKLKLLLQKIEDKIPECNGIPFVDSAPILEKALAVRAGLGWIGKNTLLVNSKIGSMCFIGSLFVDIELEANKTEVQSQCGSCSMCIDKCPNGAITEPFVLDTNRCFSYLTIEHRGEIPEEFHNSLEHRLFGCDSCINCCPFNKKAPCSTEENFDLKREFENAELFDMTQSQLKKIINNSPLRRAGLKKIRDTYSIIRKRNNPSS